MKFEDDEKEKTIDCNGLSFEECENAILQLQIKEAKKKIGVAHLGGFLLALLEPLVVGGFDVLDVHVDGEHAVRAVGARVHLVRGDAGCFEARAKAPHHLGL